MQDQRRADRAREWPRRIYAEEPPAPPFRLTPKQQAIWAWLADAPGELVPGADLLAAGWGPGYDWDHPDDWRRDSTRRMVKAHIWQLRRLLEVADAPWRIVGQYGVGWRLVRRGDA